MNKKVISLFLSAIILVSVLFSVPSISVFALTDGDPIVEYTFESEASTPQLFGNAQAQYYSERNSNVLVLDGTDNTYAQLPQGLFDNRDTITVSMDIKPQTDNGNFFTFAIGKDTASYNFLRVRGSEVRNAITVNSYTDEREVKTLSAKTDSWMNLVLVIDGVKSSIYINGSLKAVNTNTGVSLTDLGTGLVSYIGKSLYDGDAYYKGCFDNFCVYDYALSDDEIKEIFNRQSDLYPLLSGVTVGTVPENTDVTATDYHTAVSAQITDGVIVSYIRNSSVKCVPVTFSLINDDVKILSDGKEFSNGDKMNLEYDREIVFSYGERSEKYILKTPQIAVNSVLPGQYADPDIDYIDGKYWIFPTTDGFEGWGGTEFHAWSSVDMVNWVDEGVILDVKEDNPGLNSKGIQIASSKWSDGNAWAPSIEEKNGKFYFYYCGRIKSEYLDTYAVQNSDGNYNDKAIGVAVAENPQGPYTAYETPIVYPKMMKDNLNGVLESNKFSGQVIDPSVFTDDNGTSYLFFGNGNAAIATLNDDMMSVKTNSLKKINGMTDFRESVVVFKRNGTYYFTWSCDDAGSENYHIKYGTASSITTALTTTKNISVSTKGVLMQKDTSAGILGTGHQSVLYLPNVDRLFLAYHRFYTPLGIYSSSGCHRETCIDEVFFGSSDTLSAKTPTMQGIGYGVCLNGHNLTPVQITAPTCTDDGSETYVCNECNYELTYTSNQLSRLCAFGHRCYRYDVSSTCTDDGYTSYVCNLCGEEYKTDFILAVGHMFVCIDVLNLTYKCNVCEALETKSAQELFSVWDVNYINKPPQYTKTDNSSYFELNKDGIINAKDYAVLNKLRNRE
ncbi:MAG: family 43 glycosylhydrolase [Eubacterium sp.]